MYPKPVDFKFTRDSYVYIALLFLFALGGMIYTLYLKVSQLGELTYTLYTIEGKSISNVFHIEMLHSLLEHSPH